MKTSNILKLALAGGALVATVGCRHADKTAATEQPAPRTNAWANTAGESLNAGYVGVVNFRKGSDALSAAETARLNQLVASAKAAGKIEEIRVISWADLKYPDAVQKKLEGPQRNLAGERGDNIKDHIEDKLDVSDVAVYNMAERPTAVEDFFNTSDARVKNALERAGLTADTLKNPNQESKALVLIFNENAQTF